MGARKIALSFLACGLSAIPRASHALATAAAAVAGDTIMGALGLEDFGVTAEFLPLAELPLLDTGLFPWLAELDFDGVVSEALGGMPERVGEVATPTDTI